MEIKRRQFRNGTKLLSVIDRLSCQNEDIQDYRLMTQGIGSKNKDDKSGNMRSRRNDRKATMQNMNSKHKSKFPEKRIFKLKENSFGEFSEIINLNEYPYVSGQTKNKGALPIPPDVQLTLKPGIPKGVKPSLCFCKPPAQRKSNNENINQRYDSEFNSEIQSTEILRIKENSKNDTVSLQDYSQYYMDILSKESSRTSVIKYASCFSSNKQNDLNKQIDHDKQLNGNQMLVAERQIDNKQADDKLNNYEQVKGKQMHDAQAYGKQIDDEQINDKQNNGKQIDETLHAHDEQIDDGKIGDGKMDDQVIGTKEPQNRSHATKHSSLCGICLQEFPTILSLEKHRKENGHYLCSECGEAFKDDAAFREHLDKKLCKKAACIFCGLKFITRDELEKHKAVVHHKCIECNKLYNTAEKLLAHNERQHGAPYICLQCGEEFQSHALCKKHAMTRHKKKKYYCPECGRGFSRMNLLNRHATYTHSDERNFQCEICSKSFKRPDALKIHMITHSDNKPFHCEKCGKQLSQKICYTKHLPCKQRNNKTKSKNVVPRTMVDNWDKFSGEPKTLVEDLDSLSDSNLSEIYENVSPAYNGSVTKDAAGIGDKLNETNLIEIFENVSHASLGNAMKESGVNPVSEEIYMGCRCPPSCRCKKFSIGLKMQMEEPKGPTLDSTEEVASLPCCCDIGLDMPISD